MKGTVHRERLAALKARVAPMSNRLSEAIEQREFSAALNLLNAIQVEYKTAGVPYEDDYFARFDCLYGLARWRDLAAMPEIARQSLPGFRRARLALAYMKLNSPAAAMKLLPDHFFEKYGLLGVRSEYPAVLSTNGLEGWCKLAEGAALLFEGGKNTNQAIDVLKESKRLAPNDSTCLFLVGLSYEGQRKYREAIITFKKVAKSSLKYKLEAESIVSRLEQTLPKSSSPGYRKS